MTTFYSLQTVRSAFDKEKWIIEATKRAIKIENNENHSLPEIMLKKTIYLPISFKE